MLGGGSYVSKQVTEIDANTPPTHTGKCAGFSDHTTRCIDW